MKTKKFIAGVSVFAMIFGLGINYTSAEEASPIIHGDVDGDGIPQITDLTKMSLNLLGDLTFNDNQKKAADVNADNDFNIADLATMKQYVMHDDIQLGKPVSDLSASSEEFNFNDCRVINKQTTMYHEFMYNDYKNQTARSITSMKDFEEYNKLFDEKLAEVFADFNLSDEFFKDNTLVVVAKTEGSGSIEDTLTNLTIDKENGISVEISRNAPEIGDCMMAEWHMGVIVPNKYLEDVDITANVNITNVDISNKTPENKIPDTKNDTVLDASEYNSVSLESSTDFNSLSRTLTIINSVNYGRLDNIKIELGEEFDKICKSLNITQDVSGDDFYKNNSLCILPCPKLSDNVGEIISKITVNEKGKITLEITSFDLDNANSKHTGNILAFTIPNKYLADSMAENMTIYELNVEYKHEEKSSGINLSDCEIITNTCGNFDSKISNNRILTVVCSVDDLDKYKAQFDDITPKALEMDLKNLNISEEFFKENTIAIVYIPETSGSYKDKVSNVSINKDNNLSIEVQSSHPQVIQCDLIQYQFVIVIPNKLLENVDLSTINLDYVNYSSK